MKNQVTDGFFFSKHIQEYTRIRYADDDDDAAAADDDDDQQLLPCNVAYGQQLRIPFTSHVVYSYECPSPDIWQGD